MMFPLWPEDASALLNRTVIAEVAVEALGMPRSPEMAGVLEARPLGPSPDPPPLGPITGCYVNQ